MHAGLAVLYWYGIALNYIDTVLLVYPFLLLCLSVTFITVLLYQFIYYYLLLLLLLLSLLLLLLLLLSLLLSIYFLLTLKQSRCQ